MIGPGLADLDELALRCRDERARSYIAEAVTCYKAGAFRSCVVSTWIAVVYDLLQKLRELELAGSGEAKQILEAFERHRVNHNTDGLLDFERNILAMAKEIFELISPEEYDELVRLRDDRNRCAHPSLQSTAEPYAPTAELARYHLRNAVVNLLAQPPVQGQFAAERIWRQIRSEYFPTDVDEAIEDMATGPLARARPTLVRSIVVGLTKSLLMDERSTQERRRQFTALRAVLHMHRETGESVLRADLPRIFDHLEDDAFARVVKFVRRIPFGWDVLTEPNRTKVKQYVASCSVEEAASVIPAALRVPPLAETARTRLEDLPDYAISKLLSGTPDHLAVEIAIRRFVESRSFKEARSRGGTLLVAATPHLNNDQIERVLAAFVSNSQIRYATGMPVLLAKVLEQSQPLTPATRSAWQAVRDELLDDRQFDEEDRELIGLIDKVI
ncbi:MAG: hypothetical protein QOF33_3778 [Thermomicrobiales bacterium]|jgi:hypothetical protein|nr:hypothetical protein [Thermomicrobiales bacterium]